MGKLLSIILMTGCAEAVDVPEPRPVETLPAETGGSDVVPYSATAVDQPDVCSLLPDDDSACAHACDPVALLTHIPAGTCVTLECPLTDGTSYRTGACNL